MASNFEKGGKPGVESKPNFPPKNMRDDKSIQQGLGKAAVKGSQGKK